MCLWEWTWFRKRSPAVYHAAGLRAVRGQAYLADSALRACIAPYFAQPSVVTRLPHGIHFAAQDGQIFTVHRSSVLGVRSLVMPEAYRRTSIFTGSRRVSGPRTVPHK